MSRPYRATARAHQLALGLALAILGSAACSRPPAAPGFELVRAWDVPGAIAALDLSHDGQAALLGSAHGESSLWTAPWQLSIPFERAPEALLAARFTDDGRLLFLRAHGAIEVRASSGALILDPHVRLPQPAQHAAASPSGRYIAYDGSVYDLEMLRLMVKTEAASDLRAISFAGERMLLVTRAGDPQLTVLRLDGRDTELHRTATPALAGAISLDGQMRAAGTREGITLWAGGLSEPMCKQHSDAPVAALRFSRSARWLAAASGERLLVIDTTTCRVQSSVQLASAASLLDVDGDLIAIADASGRLYVWDVYNERLLAREQVFQAQVVQLRLHAATRSVLAAANVGDHAVVKLVRVGH